jgi:excisionase family DNA binding protein
VAVLGVSRLANQLGAPTSPDTLLRRIRSTGKQAAPPRFVGVDDFATKKGHHYGTIVVDLERGCVIALLPGRDGSALEEWLRKNPQVEVVTRDRWSAYAKATAAAAPQAKQVADRWHLLKNLREAVERVLTRHSSDIRLAAKEQATGETTTDGPKPMSDLPESNSPADSPASPGSVKSPPDPLPLSNQTPQHSPRQQAREERHRQVRELSKQGHSIGEIARRLRLSKPTVRSYLRNNHCPDWRPGRHGKSTLEEFRNTIETWISTGGHNARELHDQLRNNGCRASYDAVRRYIRRWIGSTGRPGPRKRATEPKLKSEPTKKPLPPPSARQLSFEVICKPKAERTTLLDLLREKHQDLDLVLTLTDELASMLRREISQPLNNWLEKAELSGIIELK